MATKAPALPFAAKESKREEAAEKKMSKAAYAKGEKKEGLHKKPAKGRKPC
jgi:hypothetical protein